jgi:serine/threonine kinase 16
MSYISDILYSVASCLTCFQSPILKINNRKFRMLKLLGEGGFSYVYLVQDSRTDKLYAVKKIRCPFGQESIQTAMREVDAYKLFKSDYIIRAVDSATVQEKEGRTVYIVLPFFERGNLQDKMNDNLIGDTSFNEKELIRLIIDVCKGIRVMHKHRRARESSRTNSDSMNEGATDGSDFVIEDENDDNDDDEEEQDPEQLRLLHEESQVHHGTATGELVPYAHRDIKPANIMLSNSGKPVLMDLGSCFRARLTLSTRKEALELQDLAAEHCTLPYRAPELFDVKTGSTVDERVDIWSLGCTIFALMYSSSPFEMQAAETGASLNMAIVNGQYMFPATPEYSEALKDLVKKCLTVDPKQRPFIDDVVNLAEALRS